MGKFTSQGTQYEGGGSVGGTLGTQSAQRWAARKESDRLMQQKMQQEAASMQQKYDMENSPEAQQKEAFGYLLNNKLLSLDPNTPDPNSPWTWLQKEPTILEEPDSQSK